MRRPGFSASNFGFLLVLVALVWAPAGAGAQEFRQMPLTDKHITSFIAAQDDFAPLVVKLSEAAEKPDDSLKGELNAVAKKHGFSGFDEYMDVNDNIAMVMAGLNSKTMEFTEPVERLKSDLEEIKADKEVAEDEKKLAIEDMTAQIAATQPLKHKENIEVVKRHFEDLAKLLPDEGVEGGDGLEGGEGDEPAGGAEQGAPVQP